MEYLVTLKSYHGRKSTSRENTIMFFFVNFKKAFDTIPGSELWKKLIEIGMSLEYRAVLHNCMSKLSAN